MVCLCPAGCRLTEDDVKERLEEAARLHAQGDVAGATAIYQAIVRQQRHPLAMHMLGVIARQQGNVTLALQFIEAALRIQPDMAAAWYNRALILCGMRRHRDAVESVRYAVQAAPAMAEAWDLFGQLLKDDHAYDEALTCHGHAIHIQPWNAHFYGNQSLTLLATGDLRGAYQAARKAVALDPAYPPVSLGNLLKALGYPEQAAACFARAHELRPDFAEAVASEAMCRLQIGDMERGWELWEKRPDLAAPLAGIPLWQGQKIERLLVYEDQGLGDALQFMRYLPLLKIYAEQVVLRIRAPLYDVAAANFPDIAVVDDNMPAPVGGDAEARCRLSSLPFFLRTRLDTIPAAPYLSAAGEARAVWRTRLAALPGPRIGLVWAGNAKFSNDPARSLPFDLLRPVLEIGAAHFVSLQKDRPDEQNALVTSGIFDAAPQLENFADSAALIAELDLVISVDTAVAHLAGALGIPVWILLPFDNDWRWLVGREDSPWYGTAKLYRQKKPGDWGPVIAQVATDVRRLAAGDVTVLAPALWYGESLRQNPDAVTLPA